MLTLNTYYTLQIYSGLAADTKPSTAPNGSIFNEIDTGKMYRFDAVSQTWINQANPTPGGEDMLYFVTFTNEGGIHSADKTYAEIVAALAGGKLPVGILGGMIYYFVVHMSGESPNQLVFSTMASISASGVSSNLLFILEDDTIGAVSNAYPGE